MRFPKHVDAFQACVVPHRKRRPFLQIKAIEKGHDLPFKAFNCAFIVSIALKLISWVLVGKMPGNDGVVDLLILQYDKVALAVKPLVLFFTRGIGRKQNSDVNHHNALQSRHNMPGHAVAASSRWNNLGSEQGSRNYIYEFAARLRLQRIYKCFEC